MHFSITGVTTESHQLYKPFLQQLSSCIFLWDPEDTARLLKATKRMLEAQGMTFSSDAGVWRHVSRKNMALHCRRRTRGAAETERLIGDLLETFGGASGRDTMGISLLDQDRIQKIWKEQRRHLQCIQDPPGVELYTETGRMTKGGISLPVYRCARGSTSLESFHLHLNRFIPGRPHVSLSRQSFTVIDSLSFTLCALNKLLNRSVFLRRRKCQSLALPGISPGGVDAVEHRQGGVRGTGGTAAAPLLQWPPAALS